jgi:hypothetical protein
MKNTNDFRNQSTITISMISEASTVNASRLRHPDTGRWFLESDRYDSFKRSSNTNLWLRGIPGCGKTVLASTVVGDLKLDDNPETAVIYFFFSFSDQKKQKLEDMLRSLIFQIGAYRTSTRIHLAKLSESCGRGTQRPLTSDLVRVFEQMADEFRSVTVVLDALDESKERRDLLRWIASVPNQHCRFLLLSRSDKDIEDVLASWLSSDHTITLEDEPIGEDLKSYIHYRLESETSFQGIRTMHHEISDALVTKAGGM